jgi:RHS repeat-associated protein
LTFCAAEQRKISHCSLKFGDTIPQNGFTISADIIEIEYLYGASGIVGFSLTHNSAEPQKYWYLKNLLGDITAIYDNDKTLVAEYKYDAWGNHTVENLTEVNIGDLNAIRYRGYYYDTETKLYYLKSRYYDPQTGRFINMDNVEILDISKNHLNGLNLYAYCFNNPVNMVDDIGNWPKWVKAVASVVVAVVVVAAVVAVTVATGGVAAPVLIGAAIGAGVGLGTSVVTQAVLNDGIENVDWGQALVDMSFGMVLGAFGGSALGHLGMAIAGAGTGFGASVSSDIVAGNDINWGKATVAGVIGGVFGAFAKGAQNNFIDIQKLNVVTNQALKSGTLQISQAGEQALKSTMKWGMNQMSQQSITKIVSGIERIVLIYLLRGVNKYQPWF